MSESTPAPLTDEQIDVHLRAIRECYDGDADAVIAAVIAKARREERERITAAIEADIATLIEDGRPLSSDEASEYDTLHRLLDYVQETTDDPR